MATAKAIFQPMLDNAFHGRELLDMLAGAAPESVLISSAFVNSAGVRMVAAALTPHARVSRVFVGIRNGVTTFQGIKALLNAGVAVHVVDTGTQRRIFHPKFYVVRKRRTAQAVIGSANLTYGGLGSNIEASVRLDLDLTDPADAAVVDDFADTLDGMLADLPDNCFQVADLARAQELFDAGLLEDEASRKFDAPVGVASGAARPGSAVPTMRFPAMARPPATAPAAAPAPAAPRARPAAPAAPAPAPAAPVAPPVLYGPVVWVKPNLPNSDLQFPGAAGNATGVLRLTQAKYEVGGTVINQTTYFRRTVFGALPWSPAGTKEAASANFTLVIAGVVVGTFLLDLSHNPTWEAGQGNYTTAIHWGATIPYIKDPALVGRDLTLHAPSGPAAPFVIEID